MLDNVRVLAVVTVDVLDRHLPIDDQPTAARRRQDEPGNVEADELDDAVLEPRVHDGLLPLHREVVGERAGLVEVDDLDARAPLALGDGLGPGHVALVVEREDHRRAAVEEEVAHDGRGEFGIQEVGPGLHALRLHELDLPVDEARAHRQRQLPVLKRVAGLGAQELHPFRVNGHMMARQTIKANEANAGE
jgi:hypothetical protein